MAFRVTARTLLHLGAELISSDAVAFYELIKNAFDAGSKRVRINIVIRIPYEECQIARESLRKAREECQNSDQVQDANSAVREQAAIKRIRELLLSKVDWSAPASSELRTQVSEATSWDALTDILAEVNYITFTDTGEGMSLEDLDKIYLTIGTRSRLKQREQQQKAGSNLGSGNSRPLLGEKGIGRLSAMRLGNRLQVRTSKAGESHWNLLEVDWSLFSHDSDALIHEIEIAPQLGDAKNSPESSGTTVRISGLESGWTRADLEELAKEEFSKFLDPFAPIQRNPITLRYNGEAVYIPSLKRLLFEHAHAFVEASFLPSSDGGLRLIGRIDYRQKRREGTFDLREAQLTSISRSSPTILRSLGPFSMKLHWYNRKYLEAIDGIGDLRLVRELQASWAGGLMLYRDGFRVNPYGSPEDDWLNLDKKALGAKGYKINRRQIIGKVDISSVSSPNLVDQTNREGLRDCEEKKALVLLLQHIITAEFKTFMERVDREESASILLDFHELEERVETQEKKISDNLHLLIQRHPEVERDTTVVDGIREAIVEVRYLMAEANRLAESFEKGRSEIVHLAGLGLMVEVVAHELNRATSHALSTLGASSNASLPSEAASVFSTLEAQLKTLQKRLSVLDPLSTSGRQRKETFDLVAWVEDAMRAHDGQFQRHNVRCIVSPEPPHTTLRVKAVKGMIVQVLENLTDNSLYWLKQQAKLQPGFKPEVKVVVDTRAKEIRFTDNGPGIPPERRDEVFEPFVTAKPPGEGKGLGLFISREIAQYNGATLNLSDQRTIHSDALNTFVFALEGKQDESA